MMPRARLTKSAIDALPTPPSELVYWDETLPGFGVKVTPAGRKVFIVLYQDCRCGARAFASTPSDPMAGSRLTSPATRPSGCSRPEPRDEIRLARSARPGAGS